MFFLLQCQVWEEKQETQLSCRCLTFIDHSPDFWTLVETLAGLTSIWYCLKLGRCWTHLFTLLWSVLWDTRLVQICNSASTCDSSWHHLIARMLRLYSTHLFAQLFKLANIQQASTHSFRRTFATVLNDNATNVFTIQKLMRHKNIATTMLYVNVTDTQLINATNNLKLG